MEISSSDDYLAHYGTLRKSGRYPWGSGEGEGGGSTSLLDHVSSLRSQGMSEAEIARGMGMSTTKLRALKSISKNEERQAKINMAQRLREKGYSNVAIGTRMGIPESSVRALLVPGAKDKADVLAATTSMLKDQVSEKGYIDVGRGVENHVGVSRDKLNVSIAQLQEEGYKIHYIPVEQLGVGKQTTIKVLAGPDSAYADVFRNKEQIQQIQDFSTDQGRNYSKILPPLSVNSKRLGVTYVEDGGGDADGVIYVRPGVADVSLGSNRYAQVRIAVDGTHYLKGMAIYKDGLPEGTDLVFNTNKSDSGNKLDALKKMKDDPENPFGAVVRQIKDPKDPSKVTSSMNLVNEEGDWSGWSKSLSSQMLAKQTPALAKKQLDLTVESRKAQLESIRSLTNPEVRRKMLESYSDDVDSAAVHLKAAALPRQATQVILPLSKIKDSEIYAPNFRNGEKVVLVRYPHGGIFEIPELTVNNKNPEGRSLLGAAKDAVGIHPKVAERLSGADFDGDTVLVIPNNDRRVKTSHALEGLIGFDPRASYPGYPGMKKVSAQTKEHEMGKVSNLITDMTIRGATSNEIARAVRHSMVVIDAEKHGLDYKASARANGISQLKAKYQGGQTSGASTLISRASSTLRVDARKDRPIIDVKTGARTYVITDEQFTNKAGTVVRSKQKSTALAETTNAHTLSSGTPVERIYADHSNKLKSLANEARLDLVHTKPSVYSPVAKKTYAPQVEQLNSKLAIALRNAPLERQAQLIAGVSVKAKRQANPEMTNADIKRLKSIELDNARNRVGAKKQKIMVTDDEWGAIQAGAVSSSKLRTILDNADLDVIKTHAMPKADVKMSSANTSRAKSMATAGYTQAEIATALGVSVSTLKRGVES